MSNDSDNKNLPQVIPDKDIAQASKQLATVNKALTTINREKFIKFLARNKSAADFFINLIRQYSNVLDINFIEQHRDQLNWKYLSRNTSLPWSEAFIDRYKDKWEWEHHDREEDRYYDGLSNNTLAWSEALIERFANKWDWTVLAINKSVTKFFNSLTKQ